MAEKYYDTRLCAGHGGQEKERGCFPEQLAVQRVTGPPQRDDENVLRQEAIAVGNLGLEEPGLTAAS